MTIATVSSLWSAFPSPRHCEEPKATRQSMACRFRVLQAQSMDCFACGSQ